MSENVSSRAKGQTSKQLGRQAGRALCSALGRLNVMEFAHHTTSLACAVCVGAVCVGW